MCNLFVWEDVAVPSSRTTTAAPPKGARLSSEERRAALLDVAKDLVTAGGPDEVTMGNVADRAGVTRMLVYKHFENRDDLLVELYRREAKKLDRWIQAAVLAAPDGFEAKLRAFTVAVVEAVDAHGPFFSPLRSVRRDPSARRDQRSWDRRTSSYFVDLAVRDLGVDRDAATVTLGVMLTGVQSLIVQAASQRNRNRRAELVDTFVTATVGALAHLADQAGQTTGT